MEFKKISKSIKKILTTFEKQILHYIKKFLKNYGQNIKKY